MKLINFVLISVVLLFLTSCGKTCEPKIIKEKEYIYHSVPSEFLEVKKLPEIPNMTKQSELSTYMSDLWNTADKCVQNILSIEKIVDRNKSKSLNK